MLLGTPSTRCKGPTDGRVPGQEGKDRSIGQNQQKGERFKELFTEQKQKRTRHVREKRKAGGGGMT